MPDPIPRRPAGADMKTHRVPALAVVEADSAQEARRLVQSLLGEATDSPGGGEHQPRLRDWRIDAELPMPAAWEPFEGSGIAEIVAEMFPPEPRPAQYLLPGGEPDVDAFEDAADQWRERCLSLAVNAARLPELLDRLERAERVRDALLDVMARYPIPPEPVPEASPAPFADRYDAAGFAAGHDRWQQLVSEMVTARERALSTVLAEDGKRTAYLPAQFHREWVPRDLIALSALRALLDADPAVTGRLLDRHTRQHLEAMLFAGDPEVRIPDPDDPDSELYEGPASEAHRWIPPGVYPASGTSGQGQFRVVVGRTTVGAEGTASAAFPPAEHDSAVLDRIAQALEGAPENADPDAVLARIDTLVESTGRFGQGSETLLERGALLNQLLAEREQRLHPDRDRPSTPGQPGGPDLAR